MILEDLGFPLCLPYYMNRRRFASVITSGHSMGGDL